jgi:hypothetical protein
MKPRTALERAAARWGWASVWSKLGESRVLFGPMFDPA